MTIFWFFCFCIAVFYGISQKGHARILRSKLAGIAKSLEEMSQREEACTKSDAISRDRLADAKKMMSEAQEVEREADKRIIAVGTENRLLNLAVEEVVNLWVNDSFKSICDRMTSDNHATQKNRMEKVFETCRKHGIEFDGRQERAFYVRLETVWKEENQRQKAKDEQARIREIMREEQRAEKARASELKRLEQETEELERKQQETAERMRVLHELEKLKQLTADQLEELQAATAQNTDLVLQLQEKERRKSMAELTKAGHIYVISNVGSFGTGIYKVGMTRRLIPEERVKELGDASVPFPFDIHLMVATENAPTLESKLHECLWNRRLNLVNDRREFFRADLAEIKALVDKYGGTVAYEFKEVAEASQWRESENRRKQGEYGEYEITKEAPDEEDAA